jgi:hypothetical protein
LACEGEPQLRTDDSMNSTPPLGRNASAYVGLACCVVSAGVTLFGGSGSLAAAPVAQPESDPFAALAEEYSGQARPLMKQFCLGCHSTEKQKGELDLERFAQFEDVRRGTKVWLKVAEMLDNGEMPPQTSKQPSGEQRKQLRGWIERYLQAEALANAGDPGPVVLRRLNNAAYTYTIRDLTGLELNPTREFPADSAAGEGFTNTGNALVTSPTMLTKHLDAGKEIARHALLLPDGFRFSPSTTRSDWTNDALAAIRAIYNAHSDAGGASQVNLQGIIFKTNEGGRLPIERYLSATLAERDAIQAGAKTIAVVAKERGLNAKYLGILWTALNDREPSLLLDAVRAQWRTAKPGDGAALAAEIGRWQKSLWKFSSVGHIGLVGGPKAWQEPVSPLAARQDVKLKLTASAQQREVALYLTAGDAGDGNANDFVVWQQPRLVAPGRPDLLLRDVRDFAREMTARRKRTLAATAKALNAAAEVAQTAEKVDVAALARKHEVEVEALTAWLDYLGIGSGASLKLDLFTNKQRSAAKYDFVKGWGLPETPSLVANSSDMHMRIPGNMKPHGVCVHPSPTLAAAVGWKSPIAGELRIEGKVTHAHPECGDGVSWSLELRRGATRQRLANGIAQGIKSVAIGPIEGLKIQPGDLVSLLIGPRANHSCDLTDLELVLKSAGANGREWNLTRDVSDDVLAGNPHADRLGNKDVWHFYSEPVKGQDPGPVVPAGSLLARWQAADKAKEKQDLAAALQKLLTSGPAAGADEKHPDVVSYRQLTSLGGPLFARAWPSVAANLRKKVDPAPNEGRMGLDPGMFGKHPNGTAIDAASLCVQAPSVIEVRLPAELVAGAEFVTTATLHPQTGHEGSVQAQVLTTKPTATSLRPDAVILTNNNSKARKRFEKAFDEFRLLFPAALCYVKIVPVDEVVTLTLFHREDEPLRRLMLNEAEIQRLDRLWEELHFVSQDALTLVNAYEQLVEFATQDRPDMVVALKPLRKPINDRAAAFRTALADAEPKQVKALIDFAAQAYRRPLTDAESDDLRKLYSKLREQKLTHDEAFRLTLARVFIAPTFLYRLEKAPAGTKAAPVSDGELAVRLSYFLWASQPDAELRAVAEAGTLHQPKVLAQQARRMLKDRRVRRLATEFACQWLHVYDFDVLDEKSEKHFPEFKDLRSDAYEETIRFFTDLFQRDASLLSLLNADHTFVNERLAKFYGIPDVKGTAWRRIEGVQKYGRGGILGLATTLAKQSGASRTSPILRGNWVSEVLLGEKLPRPPKDVPRLPEDETATDGLTVRQLVAKHTSDARCASCHQKIDPFGFALEGFDAIGRLREKDLAGRPIDVKTKLPDGKEINGLTGLRDYLVNVRRDDVVRQFCRKLLGYALGRGIQLSDEPLLREMQQQLKDNDYRFTVAVDAIIQSRQFREIRGRDAPFEESP